MDWKKRKKELGGRVAKALFESKAIKFGEFTLTSGKKSPYYIDMRAVPSYPEQFDIVTDAYKEIILNEGGAGSTLVGVPTAGIPFASVAGYKAGMPVAYIRKEALKRTERGHGLMHEIEGVIREDMPPVLVDDLISTGKSNLAANEVMKRNGFVISEAYLLVNRQQGGVGKLAEEGIAVHYIVPILELVAFLEGQGDLTTEHADKVREYTEAGI